MFIHNKRLIPWLLGLTMILLTSVATIGGQSPIAFASSQSCAQQCGSTTNSCFKKCVNGQHWCQNGDTEVNGKCVQKGSGCSGGCPSGYQCNQQQNSCTQDTTCQPAQYQFGGCSGNCAIVITRNMPACTPTQSLACPPGSQWASNCQTPTTTPTSSSPTTSPTTSPTSSNPPPSCTAPPGGARSYSGSFVPNGCAGSCSSTGCSPTHEETGTITTTTVHTWYTCPGPTEHSSTSQSIQNTTASSSTNCAEITKPLSCVKNKPGYAWEENCLVYNGQDTHCSQPFQHYDPINCPVPVPVNN